MESIKCLGWNQGFKHSRIPAGMALGPAVQLSLGNIFCRVHRDAKHSDDSS